METKICTKCNKKKSILEFYKQRLGRFGVTSVCKTCRKKIYVDPNKDKIKKRLHNYYIANKEKSRLKSIAYRAANKERLASNKKIYYEANKDKLKDKSKQRYNGKKKEISKKGKVYRLLNKAKIKARNRAYSATHKQESNERRRRKGKTDTKFKLNRNISSAVSASLKRNKKGMHWEDIVEWTLNDIKKHLEKQFTEGMNWENYGAWHIDHKTPVSVFNFTKPEHNDFKRCWALSNLQPLWATENMIKHAKITKPFQPSLLI